MRYWARDSHLVRDSQTVVMFPSSLYFLDTESPCVRCTLHRWPLSPCLVSWLVASQKARVWNGGLPSLPVLADCGSYRRDGAKRRVSSAWCCVHTLRSTDSPDAPGYPGSQDFSASSQLASPSWMATVTFLSILGSLVSRLPTAQLISRFTPREALCHVWTWRCH